MINISSVFIFFNSSFEAITFNSTLYKHLKVKGRKFPAFVFKWDPGKLKGKKQLLNIGIDFTSFWNWIGRKTPFLQKTFPFKEGFVLGWNLVIEGHCISFRLLPRSSIHSVSLCVLCTGQGHPRTDHTCQDRNVSSQVKGEHSNNECKLKTIHKENSYELLSNYYPTN